MADTQGLRLAQPPFEAVLADDGEHASILDRHGGIVGRLKVAEAANELMDVLNMCAEHGGLDLVWASGGHPPE